MWPGILTEICRAVHIGGEAMKKTDNQSEREEEITTDGGGERPRKRGK